MTALVRNDDERLLVRAGWLYDPVARSILRHGWFLVEGQTVAARGRGAEAPTDVPTLDLSTCLVTPGLIDAHCHLMLPGDGSSPEDYVARSNPMFFAAVATGNLLAAAEHGVTTVCDLGSPALHLLRLRDDLERPSALPAAAGMRDRVEQRRAGIDHVTLEAFLRRRRVPLPRILAAGAPLTPTGGHMDYFGGVADDAEALLRLVRRQRAAGADLVKVVGNGGGTRYSLPWVPYFDVGALRLVANEAHAYGETLTIHANHVDVIRTAVDAGFDGIEHASFTSGPGTQAIDEGVVERMARAGTWVTPTPLATQRTVDVLEEQQDILDEQERAYLDGRRRYRDAGIAAIGRLHAAGVRLAVGTDAGWRVVRPTDYRSGLGLLQEAGLSFEEMLFAATLGGATARGRHDDLGSLAEGAAADFTAFTWAHETPPAALPERVEATFVAGVQVYAAAALR